VESITIITTPALIKLAYKPAITRVIPDSSANLE